MYYSHLDLSTYFDEKSTEIEEGN